MKKNTLIELFCLIFIVLLIISISYFLFFYYNKIQVQKTKTLVQTNNLEKNTEVIEKESNNQLSLDDIADIVPSFGAGVSIGEKIIYLYDEKIYEYDGGRNSKKILLVTDAIGELIEKVKKEVSNPEYVRIGDLKISDDDKYIFLKLYTDKQGALSDMYIFDISEAKHIYNNEEIDQDYSFEQEKVYDEDLEVIFNIPQNNKWKVANWNDSIYIVNKENTKKKRVADGRFVGFTNYNEDNNFNYYAKEYFLGKDFEAWLSKEQDRIYLVEEKEESPMFDVTEKLIIENINNKSEKYFELYDLLPEEIIEAYREIIYPVSFSLRSNILGWTDNYRNLWGMVYVWTNADPGISTDTSIFKIDTNDWSIYKNKFPVNMTEIINSNLLNNERKFLLYEDFSDNDGLSLNIFDLETEEVSTVLHYDVETVKDILNNWEHSTLGYFNPWFVNIEDKRLEAKWIDTQNIYYIDFITRKETIKKIE